MRKKFMLVAGLAAVVAASACETNDGGATTASATADDMAMADDMMMSDGSSMVGGAEMLPSRNIIENAVNSADHTTLVAAVTAAGLVDTLSGPGPFTVFAPTNAAFDALPAGTVETLLKPENKDMLVKILTAHVVAGDMSAAALTAKAAEMGGNAELTPVSGDTLTFSVKEGLATVGDESGGSATITIADVDQSNGVIHVVDKVLLPK